MLQKQHLRSVRDTGRSQRPPPRSFVSDHLLTVGKNSQQGLGCGASCLHLEADAVTPVPLTQTGSLQSLGFMAMRRQERGPLGITFRIFRVQFPWTVQRGSEYLSLFLSCRGPSSAPVTRLRYVLAAQRQAELRQGGAYSPPEAPLSPSCCLLIILSPFRSLWAGKGQGELSGLSFPGVVLTCCLEQRGDTIFPLLVTVVAVATSLKMKETKKVRNTARGGGRAGGARSHSGLFPSGGDGETASASCCCFDRP